MRSIEEIHADLMAVEDRLNAELDGLEKTRKEHKEALADVTSEIAKAKQRAKSDRRKLHLELGEAHAAADAVLGGGDGA